MVNDITSNTTKVKVHTNFNKWAYGLFILLGIYLMIFSKDFMTGVSNLGIALVFDPFDQNVSWKNRPLYQKVWLFVHVVVVLSLFAYAAFMGK